MVFPIFSIFQSISKIWLKIEFVFCNSFLYKQLIDFIVWLISIYKCGPEWDKNSKFGSIEGWLQLICVCFVQKSNKIVEYLQTKEKI